VKAVAMKKAMKKAGDGAMKKRSKKSLREERSSFIRGVVNVEQFGRFRLFE
jgi:hypothetical protein